MSLLLGPVLLMAACLLGALAYRRLRGRGAFVRILGAATAFAGTLAAAFASLVGIFVVGTAEPWPLSLRQGPDTDFARRGFERQLGLAPPATVTDLYYRNEWGFGGDSIHSFRFRFEDPSVVRAIVAGQGLSEAETEDRAEARYLAGPPWWPEREELNRLPRVYSRRGSDTFWIDEANGRAYFQRANF